MAVNSRITVARLLLLTGALAVPAACTNVPEYSNVGVQLPQPPPDQPTPTCTPVACPDNDTTSTCPGSTHCYNGYCIDSSCQQICTESDGTPGVVQDDAGSTMVKPCQVIACGTGFCVGKAAACCGGTTCTSTDTDSNNCGGCGIHCTAPSTCSGGSCNCGGSACTGSQTCCTNSCRDLTSDRLNCGSCGAPCANGFTCSFSACTAGCYIGGVTYAAGTPNPAGTCQVCQPFGSGGSGAWTPAADGQACSVGGNVCVGGTCHAGCLISYLPDGTSQAPTLEPVGWSKDGCYACNPATYITRLTYTPSLSPINCKDPNIQPYPFPSAGIAGGVGDDGRFWVTGGWNFTGPGGSLFISNEAWGYSPVANNWVQSKTTMTQHREEAAGTASGTGVIFIFGGLDALSNPLATVEHFDPASPTPVWTALPLANNLSVPRHFASAVYVASTNLIYVIGGEQGWNGFPNDTIETYKTIPPYTHTVLAAASTAGLLPPNPLLTGPTGQPAIIGSSLIDGMNGHIYAVGGLTAYSLYAHQSVWDYNIAGNSWTWAPAMASAQCWAGTVVAPPASTVYEINGFNGFGPSTNLQTATIVGTFISGFAGTLNQPNYAREGGMAFYSPTDNRIYLIGGTYQGVYLAPQSILEALPLNVGFGAWVPQY